MPIIGPWVRKKALITARTYPAPARKSVEVSCTAGITGDGEWIRLFPIPYRFLDPDQRFRKYQWIEFNAAKSSDPRPESFQIDVDSLQILTDPLPTTFKWQPRKEIVFPLKTHCLCCLQAERNQSGKPTLGFFKPKAIRRLRIESDSPDWTPDELAKLRQHSLFKTAPLAELEKIPYRFFYSFVCDEDSCRGHNLSCTDWELGQSYRKWRRKYGSGWEDAIRTRYELEMINTKDTHFFVGTVREHPSSWIIVGLFYPPN